MFGARIVAIDVSIALTVAFWILFALIVRRRDRRNLAYFNVAARPKPAR